MSDTVKLLYDLAHHPLLTQHERMFAMDLLLGERFSEHPSDRSAAATDEVAPAPSSQADERVRA